MSEDFAEETKKLVNQAKGKLQAKKSAAAKPAPAKAAAGPKVVTTLPPIVSDPRKVYRSIQIDVAAEEAGVEAAKTAKSDDATKALLKGMGFVVD